MLNVNRMKKKTRLSYYSSRPSSLVCKPTNIITPAEVEKVEGQLKTTALLETYNILSHWVPGPLKKK